MGHRKIIEYATQAFAVSATEVKGGEHSTKKADKDNSVNTKENIEHNISGSDLFNVNKS